MVNVRSGLVGWRTVTLITYGWRGSGGGGVSGLMRIDRMREVRVCEMLIGCKVL